MTIVMVPSTAEKSAMVRGMRSPTSVVRTMTNWPGLQELAIAGQ
jgi:hypothetical protein